MLQRRGIRRDSGSPRKGSWSFSLASSYRPLLNKEAGVGVRQTKKEVGYGAETSARAEAKGPGELQNAGHLYTSKRSREQRYL